MVGRRRSLDVRERDEDHSTDTSGECRVEEVAEPPGVRLRQEPLGSRVKEPTGEVNDAVGAFDGGRERFGTSQIGVDDLDA